MEPRTKEENIPVEMKQIIWTVCCEPLAAILGNQWWCVYLNIGNSEINKSIRKNLNLGVSRWLNCVNLATQVQVWELK